MKNKIVMLGLLALAFSVGSRTASASSPQMVGTNLSGGDFGGAPYPGTIPQNYFYPNAGQWDWAKSQGLELVRMPFRWERVQYDVNGVLNNFLNAPDITAIDAALDLAESRGTRVILDMHNYASRRLTINGVQSGYNIGSAELPISVYADVWRLLADHFKNRTCIWGYDIMNEPVGVGVTAWVSAAQAAVTAIRDVDMTHAIILEGYFYAHTDSWLTNGAPLLSVVDPANNLIFSGHMYPDRDGSGTWSKGGTVTAELIPGKYPDLNAAYNVGVDRVKPFVDWCVANNVRGLLGEFGTPAILDSDNWNIILDRTYAYIKNNSNNLVSSTQWGGGAWNATYVIRMGGLVDSSQPRFMIPVVSNYVKGASTNWWSAFTWYDDAITTTADYSFSYAFASTTPAATCTFSIGDTSTFFSGAKSAALNYTIPAGGYAGAGMHIRGPLSAGAVGGVDISKSVAAGHVLSFYAKGTPGATPTITLGTTSNASGVDSGSDTGTGNWISISGIAPLTSSWQRYEIPLSSFLNAQITGAERIQRLRFTAGPANGTAYQVNFDRITIGLRSTNTAPTVSVDTSTGGSTFSRGQSITLVSTATDADAGDSIDYVEFYANHEKVGLATAAPYQYTTSFATAGDYVLTAIAFDSHGVVQQSAAKTITIIGLDSPWSTQDVGAVAATGNATNSGGTFTVAGSGADIQGMADEFRYAYQAASGDCTIIARVASIQNVNGWSKAGVMIRETLAADSKNAFCGVTPTHGMTFQRRLTTAAATAVSNISGFAAPYWVKIVRTGNTFTGSRSADGLTWTTMGTVTIAMGTDVYIGLAVSSVADGTLCTSTFDNITATP